MRAPFQGEPGGIAIIGIGCRFPGGVSTPRQFWDLLIDRVNAIGTIPPSRSRDWNISPKLMTRFAGVVEGIECFDAACFGLSPREAERLDPQQRLLLETAWESLEDAGQPADSLAGIRTGVFTGLWQSDYESELFRDPSRVDFYATTGTGRYAAAGRISYFFGFEGPSMTIDTACSSSLVAVHLACRSLRAGECTMALAGGANINLRPHITIAYSQSNMMARDGRCKFGDARADGYVRSEGAATVVLKPLEQALADGDPIYAVILGTAVNNDGRGSGYLVTPSRDGQEKLLWQAYADAGVTPAEADYIEAHGTGTAVGDPVELAALGAVLAKGRPAGAPCYVGSVKTNIGHTESAAGVAGLIKAALALQHRTIPASLHCERPNSAVAWEDLPVRMATQARPWPGEPGKGIAGVSSFGITGTNAHVVLGEAPARTRAAGTPDRAHILGISVRTPEAAAPLALAYASLVRPLHEAELADVCYSAARRRTHHEYRIAFAGENGADLAELLAAPSRAPRAAKAPGKIVFVFPGQGSQWLGMGRQLLRREATFRAALERCQEAMFPFTDWRLLEQLAAEPDSPGYRLADIDCIQPTLVALEIALAELWRSWGIEPDAVIGHSMGEVAAAHVAGALTLHDAFQVICRRSRLLRGASGRGGMAVVELPAAEALASLAPFEGCLAIAASNSSTSTVVSGNPEILDEWMARIGAREIFCRRVNVDVASHSPQMDALQEDLRSALARLEPRVPFVPVYSTTLGEVITGAACDASYWVRNLREPVLFSQMVQHLLDDGHAVFLEMSPHPILLQAIEQTMKENGVEGVALPSLRRGESEQAALLDSLGRMYELGCSVRWDRLYPAGNCVSLPPYPWQKERYWIDGVREPLGRRRMLGTKTALAGEETFLWQSEIGLRAFPYLKDHRVRGNAVLPAAAFLEMALAAGEEVLARERCVVEDLRLEELFPVPEDGGRALQVFARPEPSGGIRIEFFGSDGAAADPQWVCHARARVRAAGDLAAAPLSGMPLLPEEAEFYCVLAADGLEYGPAFRWIARIGHADGKVAAELRVPEELDLEESETAIHPALLDAMLQLLLLDQGTGSTRVPLRIAAFQLHRAAQEFEPMRACAVQGGPGTAGNALLWNCKGELIAELRGVEFEALPDGRRIEEYCYTTRWLPQPAPAALAETRGRWLIVSDATEFGEEVAAVLERRHGSPVILRGEIRGEEIASLLPCTGVIHARGLELTEPGRAQEEMCVDLLQLVQVLARCDEPPRLWLVTSGVQAPAGNAVLRPAQAVLWGMGAVIAMEEPRLKCCRIDLEPGMPEAAKVLAAELALGGSDAQVALRSDGRYVARLAPSPPAQSRDVRQRVARGVPFALQIDKAGSLDALSLRPMEPRSPGPGEVEVEILAAGLNFIDVLKALGIYPGLPPGITPGLGGECAGRVIAVGESVTSVLAGDEVIAITPSFVGAGLFRTAVTLPEEYLIHKPARLSFQEAAALPIAFLTSSYALHHVAQLRSGETVLIHSAAGGVGQAAIQLARASGANVIATAGGHDKREYLRRLGVAHVFDSHSLAFAGEVLAVTGGTGVDVVLNSLGGEAIAAGLAVLAPGGRFVEIGKRDLFGNTRIELGALKQNRSFSAVDLAAGIEARPRFFMGLLRELVASVDAGRLDPLPVRSFPISRAEDAFRLMSQGAHTGKLVLSLEDTDVEIAVRPADGLVRADRTYLITGGAGALGLATARWLVERGARHLVLAGRGKPSAEACPEIQGLAAGANVRYLETDVSDFEATCSLVAQIGAAGPALGGIFHAAGVLDDATLQQLDPERLLAVMAPKVRGAWNLHVHTTALPLDFFVLFSSVSATLGIPGQANYAAGNAFLDALARFRRSQGKVALSIPWGPWAHIGLAAARSDRGRRLATLGLGSIAPEQGVAALDVLLASAPADTMVMKFDLAKWTRAHPAADAAFFGLLGQEAPEADTPSRNVREWVLEREPGRARRERLEQYLCEQVALILRIAPSRVALHKPFKALGLDSLMTLEFRNRIETGLGVRLSPAVFWNHPNILELTPVLAGTMGISLQAEAPPRSNSGSPGRDAPLDLDDLIAAELASARTLLESVAPEVAR